MVRAACRGERSMLALSSRPWLGYSGMGKFNLVPMSYEALDYASGRGHSFSFPQVHFPLFLPAAHVISPVFP